MVCRDEASSRVRWRRTAIRNSIKRNCDLGVAIFNLGPAVRYEVRPMRRRHSRRTYDKRKLVFHRTTKVVSTRSSPPWVFPVNVILPRWGDQKPSFSYGVRLDAYLRTRSAGRTRPIATSRRRGDG
jgi:hypothetical protein